MLYGLKRAGICLTFGSISNYQFLPNSEFTDVTGASSEALFIYWQMLPERFLVGVKDAEDDDGSVWLDGKMDGVRKDIDRFNPDVVVADGRSGRQTADLFKIAVQEISELEAQPVGAIIVVLECLIDVVYGIGGEDDGMGHQGRLYFCLTTSQG